MELASDNAETWTIEKITKSSNRNMEGEKTTMTTTATKGSEEGATTQKTEMTEMEKLKLRNRKNCKVVNDALKLLMFTRERLNDMTKKLKAALV